VLLFYHTLNVYQTRQGTKTTNKLKIKTYFLSLTEELTNLSTVALLKFSSRKENIFARAVTQILKRSAVNAKPKSPQT